MNQTPFTPSNDQENDILEAYLNYLIELATNGNPRHLNKEMLFRLLHRIEFYELIPNDNNRGDDGKAFREQFMLNREDGADIALSLCLDGPCTFLEMMLGLADRISIELKNSAADGGYSFKKKTPPNDLSYCFWVLMGHLDMSNIDNKSVTIPKFYDFVTKKVSQVLERTYSFNGIGGLFPLRSCTEDQRKVELWYQMHSWLQENYIF